MKLLLPFICLLSLPLMANQEPYPLECFELEKQVESKENWYHLNGHRYPIKAVRDGIQGCAIVKVTKIKVWRPKENEILQEFPDGYGFGKEAKRRLPKFFSVGHWPSGIEKNGDEKIVELVYFAKFAMDN